MNTELVEKLQRAARAAVQVQNACNLSGVVRSFNETLIEVVWPIATELGYGTKWVNNHPISRAYADKIASLANVQYDMDLAIKAIDQCELIASTEGYYGPGPEEARASQ